MSTRTTTESVESESKVGQGICVKNGHFGVMKFENELLAGGNCDCK